MGDEEHDHARAHAHPLEDAAERAHFAEVLLALRSYAACSATRKGGAGRVR